MDQGTIVEAGTHEELMKAKGTSPCSQIRKIPEYFTDCAKNFTFLALYYKLVTTSNGEAEPEAIATLLEEGDVETNVLEGESLAPRLDVKRRSTRRVHRHHSLKRGLTTVFFLTYITSFHLDQIFHLTIIRWSV